MFVGNGGVVVTVVGGGSVVIVFVMNDVVGVVAVVVFLLLLLLLSLFMPWSFGWIFRKHPAHADNVLRVPSWFSKIVWFSHTQKARITD